MAFALKGAGGTTNSGAANQSSVTLTTATTAGASGDLAVLRYALDNSQTTDGDEGAVTGISDSAGNTWVKAVEFTNGQGGTQAGVVCGIWYSNITAALPTSSTITLSLTNNTLRDASAIGLEYFTKAAGFNAAIEGTPGTLADDGAAAGSLNVTTSNIACLRIRAIASESSVATALTKTAAFTAVLGQDLTTGGSSASNVGIRGEYLISTSTGQASAPTGGAGAVDNSSVYVAFREDAVTQPLTGWLRGNDIITAAVPVWSALLLCTQATSFAAPAPVSNSVSQFGWFQQLSTAPKVAAAQPTQPIVPFPTTQAAPPVPQGWQTIASAAPPRAVISGSALTFVVPPFNVPLGWRAQQNNPVPVAKAQLGSTVVPFNTPQVAASSTPYGWLGQTPQAAKQAAPVPTQATSFQSPSPASNNTTAKAWHQPLSVAVPVAQAKPGFTSVPFNTVQVAAGTPQGWQSIASVAPVRASVNNSALTFVVPPVSVPIGWQGQGSGAAPIAKIQTGSTFVPFNTVQVTPAPAFGWHVPLSIAAQVAKVQVGNSSVPFNTAQTNTATIDKWLQPLAKPVPVAQAQPGNSFVPLNTAQINTVTIDKWQQPLSKAVAVAKAQQGEFFVPFPAPTLSIALVYDAGYNRSVPVYYQALFSVQRPITSASNNVTGLGWHQALSKPTNVAKANPTQATTFAAPASASNSVSQFGWYQPLSKPAPVAQAQQGSSFVPFNTAQTVQQYPLGWLQPLSVAVRSVSITAPQPTLVNVPVDVPRGWLGTLSTAPIVAKAQISSLTLPPYVASTDNNVTLDKWQQPFSKPVSVAKAVQGNADVPLNTAQTSTQTPQGWQQPLSVPVKTAQAQLGSSFVPLDTAQTNTATIDKWLQPLSKAVAVAQALPGWTFVPFDTVQAVPTPSQFGWWQQLSKAAPVAQALAGWNVVPLTATIPPPFGWHQPLAKPVVSLVAAPQGWTFVPLNTAQSVTPTPSQFGWWAQFSAPAPIVQAQQGNAFVPFDTVQVAPPVDDTTRGSETVLTDRGPSVAISRKRWREILEELEAEQKAKSPKATKAIGRAVKDVESAIDDGLVDENIALQLAIMVSIAKQATVAEAIRQANEIRATIAQIEEEDEEDILTMLMS